MSDASKRKAKQKWAIEKTKLDNARKLCGTFFIEPEDEEFKHIMTNACRKLEIPMPATMRCKTSICHSSGETRRGEGVPCRYHEDLIAAKGMNSLSHYNFLHKFVPMPQAMKITGCKGRGGQRMRKTREE